MKITINNTVFNIEFDYECLRVLAQKWGLKGPGSVGAHIESGVMDEIEALVDLIETGVQTREVKGDAEAPTRRQIGNFVMKPENSESIIKGFQESFPTAEPEPEGKLKAGEMRAAKH